MPFMAERHDKLKKIKVQLLAVPNACPNFEAFIGVCSKGYGLLVRPFSFRAEK